ncbi:MAG: hypothetical protein ABL982_18720 [Vicinamibacterales bacterium]
MMIPRLVSILAIAAVVSSCGGSTPAPQPAPAPAASTQNTCAPAGNLQFVCGLQAAEDLVVVPSTRFLMASGMQPGSGFHLVDTQAKTAQALPFSARPDTTRFPACPSPLDPAVAVLHGLSLRGDANGHYTLYATNHGGRESIEVFDVDATAAIPAAAWIGCVVLPDPLSANSVAAFTDGTIVATVLTMPGKGFPDIFAGRPTGIVLMWTPGSAAFRQLPGTELAGNNGIETSPDDREFYVAASGSKRVVAFSRANPSVPLRTAQLAEAAPDNVRFVGSELWAAGMIDEEAACGGAPKKPEDIQCPRGYLVSAVNPQTMAVREVARGPRAEPYGGTATGVQVGNELWLSSFNGDRIAYRMLP